MPAQRETIYVEVVVLKPENAVELRESEVLAIPCNFLLCREAEKRMLVIEYTPGSPLTTRAQVLAVHLRAYGRRYKVLSYHVFDGFATHLLHPTHASTTPE